MDYKVKQDINKRTTHLMPILEKIATGTILNELLDTIKATSEMLHNTMIIEVFTPKLKKRVRPPPSERNRTQDTPDRLKFTSINSCDKPMQSISMQPHQTSHRGFSYKSQNHKTKNRT